MPNELSYEVSLERSNQIRADLPQHPEKYTMLTGDRPTGRLHTSKGEVMPNELSYEVSLERSNQIRADLPQHPEKYTMLTGDRPTGRLHLGHYFAAIKSAPTCRSTPRSTPCSPAIAPPAACTWATTLAPSRAASSCRSWAFTPTCSSPTTRSSPTATARTTSRTTSTTWHTNVLIADYQVITDRDSTDNIQDNVYNMVIDYLACGLDPDKTMIYTHSAVPACNQLMLPFLSLVSEALLQRNPTVKAEMEASGHECGLDPDKTMIYTHSAVPACNQLMLPFLSLVSEALLQRNPTVKAEMEASGHELTGLLLTYPVHQACDILFCKGNVVPVGRDQLPHIELTRTIARKFNNRYGNVFPEVDALLSDTPLLPGLDGRKMSKSYGNAINISMTAEETAKRIKKSQTDGERMITFDPEARPGVSGLLSTAAICTGRSEVEIAEEIGMGGSGQLKKYVTESVNEYFLPIRARREELVQDMDYVKDPRGTGPGYGLRQGRPARGQSPCQRGRRGDARRGARSHGNGVLGHPPRWHARRHSNGPPSRARAFDIARSYEVGDNKPASFFTLYGGLHVPTCCQRYG